MSYAIELIDLRSLLPWDAVLESVKKTGRCLVIHEAAATGDFGGEVAAVVAGSTRSPGSTRHSRGSVRSTRRCLPRRRSKTPSRRKTVCCQRCARCSRTKARCKITWGGPFRAANAGLKAPRHRFCNALQRFNTEDTEDTEKNTGK